MKYKGRNKLKGRGKHGKNNSAMRQAKRSSLNNCHSNFHTKRYHTRDNTSTRSGRIILTEEIRERNAGGSRGK